jgi:hypothetical protein
MELPQRRRQLILAQLQRTGAAQISDLTGRFGISATTARRDLDVLADRGTARRVHGGAVLASLPPPAPVHAPPAAAESAAAPALPSTDAPAVDAAGVAPPRPFFADAAEAHFTTAQRLAARAEGLLRQDHCPLAEAYCQLADLHLRLALFARSR